MKGPISETKRGFCAKREMVSPTGCPRPILNPHVEALGLQLFSPPGAEAHLTCAPGYTTQSGVGVIICSIRGTWGRTELVCQRGYF